MGAVLRFSIRFNYAEYNVTFIGHACLHSEYLWLANYMFALFYWGEPELAPH